METKLIKVEPEFSVKLYVRKYVNVSITNIKDKRILFRVSFPQTQNLIALPTYGMLNPQDSKKIKIYVYNPQMFKQQETMIIEAIIFDSLYLQILKPQENTQFWQENPDSNLPKHRSQVEITLTNIETSSQASSQQNVVSPSRLKNLNFKIEIPTQEHKEQKYFSERKLPQEQQQKKEQQSLNEPPPKIIFPSQQVIDQKVDNFVPDELSNSRLSSSSQRDKQFFFQSFQEPNSQFKSVGPISEYKIQVEEFQKSNHQIVSKEELELKQFLEQEIQLRQDIDNLNNIQKDLQDQIQKIQLIKSQNSYSSKTDLTQKQKNIEFYHVMFISVFFLILGSIVKKIY